MISRRTTRKAGCLVECALTLNIDQLIRAGGLRPWPTSGQVSWTLAPGQSTSVNFTAYPAIPGGFLQLEFAVSGSQLRQTIALATTTPHFGGTRWWFICPVTGERVGRLHLPPGASQFASRQAHGLTYACQTEDFYARAARRSRKLSARLGDDIGPPSVPLKPKGMRWTTYARHLEQIKRFEGTADGWWLKLAARWSARGLL
jgi:hypothetical protein